MLVMSEDVYRWFNLCEGIFWIAIAVGLAVIYCCRRKDAGLTLTASLLFLAFGISDFVEITTGAWYKPWWLFLWKAGCVVGFVPVYILFHRRLRRAVTQDTSRKAWF